MLVVGSLFVGAVRDSGCCRVVSGSDQLGEWRIRPIQWGVVFVFESSVSSAHTLAASCASIDDVVHVIQHVT